MDPLKKIMVESVEEVFSLVAQINIPYADGVTRDAKSLWFYTILFPL